MTDKLVQMNIEEQPHNIALLTEMVDLESLFQNWLHEFYQRSMETKPQAFMISNISHFQSFIGRCGELINEVPKVFQFPFFLSAMTPIDVCIHLLAEASNRRCGPQAFISTHME